ncbi:hypothetical protein BCV70DRAFT_105481 [Testicularia cyperi]|uniref:Uncharacterized protein n=1 Tax=Testicularia cyperi TaxID=1882483 RepID=A0A317XPX6_9BASI|nr:hypothetical protein BCV70DRAFT_105481 [Testicularia cyperi]
MSADSERSFTPRLWGGLDLLNFVHRALSGDLLPLSCSFGLVPRCLELHRKSFLPIKLSAVSSALDSQSSTSTHRPESRGQRREARNKSAGTCGPVFIFGPLDTGPVSHAAEDWVTFGEGPARPVVFVLGADYYNCCTVILYRDSIPATLHGADRWRELV